MASAALWVLLVLQCGLGHSSHKGHEDHYIGEAHNLEHELSLLFGNENHEEQKQLSPEEQKEKIMDIVKQIDTNSDNQLNEEEMTVWIQHVYRKYALEDANEQFSELDTDKDGVVTWVEYNMVTHNKLPSFDESAVSNDPEQESLRLLHLKEKKRFDFADVDGVPGLNVTELLAFIHPSEVDRMSDFTIEDVLAEYDTDKDGLISLSEFLGHLRNSAEDAPSQWEAEETVRFNELYDQDKDGKLNRDEQLRWIAPNSYGAAREEVLHLIKEMDHNGDGQISEAEVLQNQDTFINSEVADYGRFMYESHDEL